MNAVGWMWLRRLHQRALSPTGKANRHSQTRRKIAPSLQVLEAIELLSTGGPVIGHPAARWNHAEHHLLSGPVSRLNAPNASGMSDSSQVILPAQTASIGNTPTNFASLPLTPALNLFDPSLGTLVSVVVSHTAVIQSNITSRNTSITSPADNATASVSGSFQIDGLNPPISQPTQTVTSQPISLGESGSGNDTATFPPLQIANSSSVTITDSAGLAFYTASPGRQSITLTMTATATASASASNGNLLTATESFASGTVTIAYTYVPVCPTAVGIGRIGLHHQQTQIVVTYSGVVNPVLAENPNDYTVITRAGKKIPIVSATYDASTNSVTLIPAHRLNVHHRFLLSALPPCASGQPGNAQILPFGGKRTLLGFYNHRGQFVPFHPRGSAGSESRRGQSVAVHQIARSQI